MQLQQEMDKSRVLQDALHALATEHHELEQSIVAPSSPPRIYDTEDDEFYDCDEESEDANGESAHLLCSASII